MIRKFVEKITEEQLKKDLEKYKEKAVELGLTRAKGFLVHAREILNTLSTNVDPMYQAFEAFIGACSIEEMTEASSLHSILTEPKFILAIEQLISQEKMSPERKRKYEARLTWLKQIAEENRP